MQKKLQVFISSTFTDLIEERQAAVEAVLNSGHIPAGMELFKAGDSSQKETIKRWIEESDVYMLILGGRYGSIEESTGKSYTHWEYDFAGELGKPRFAMVINEEYLDSKVKTVGANVMERENFPKYQEFKEDVLSKISKFFSDTKDIKLTVLESLKEFERDEDLQGWVSGKDVSQGVDILKKNFDLLEDNSQLKEEVKKLELLLEKKTEIGNYSYKEVKSFLLKEKISIPSYIIEKDEDRKIPLLLALSGFRDTLITSVTNNVGMSKEDKFIFFRLAPKLMSLSLVEKAKVTGQAYQRMQLSENGLKFLGIYDLEKSNKETDAK